MARLNLNLEMIGVPLGAKLVHVNDPELVGVVVNQNPPSLSCKGMVGSLMETAQLAFQNPGPLQGSQCWKYEGETLQERRNRFEKYHRHK